MDYDTICNENGNLLANETSFAPTSAPPPPDVVDVIDDADNVADVFNSTTTSDVDSDGDGLSVQDEVTIYRTDPAVIDTDSDGLSDGYEHGNDASPGCRAWSAYEEDGASEAYATNLTALVDFTYEIAIDIDSTMDIDDVMGLAMERNLALLVGRALIRCGEGSTTRRRGEAAAAATVIVVGGGEDGRRSRHLYIEGIEPTPIDAVVADATCKYYTINNPAPVGTDNLLSAREPAR